MESPRLPNFFIAGAPKTGTTSLYFALRQHPDVYMSPMKEPTFFAPELWPENFIPELREKAAKHVETVRRKLGGTDIDLQEVATVWEDYLKLFAGAGQERAVGEGSVCYLWSKTAPAAIAEQCPDAKLILVLRHPAERAYSQYRSYASMEAKPQSFREHIEQSLAYGDRLGLCNPLLQFGLYAEQIERYRKHFAEEQIRVWLYEDTLRNPAVFLREVFEFLGVDASFVPDTSTRYKEVQVLRAPRATRFLRDRALRQSLGAAVPKALLPMIKKIVYGPHKAIRMNVEDRRYLVDFYRDDVSRLETMIDRDLCAWLA